MTISETGSINDLCNDVKSLILFDVIRYDRNLNCRLVCREWKQCIETQVVQMILQELRTQMNRIPKEGLHLSQFITTFIEESVTSQCDIKRFLRFNHQLKTIIGPIKEEKEQEKRIIIAFPEDIQSLTEKNTNLHILWTAIQHELGSAPSLQSIDEIHAWMKVNPEKLASVTKLDLRKKELTALPPEIGYLTHLQTLNLAYNGISHLPPELGHLTQLDWLNLSHNRITHLLPEVNNLVNLEWVDLSHNLLKEISIEHLPSLKLLILSHNRMANLSLKLNSLSHLKWLDLSHNEITNLPREIVLPQLKWLNLSNNKIESVEFEIENFPQLQELHLSCNQMADFSLVIKNYVQLLKLDLSQNKITTLFPKIKALEQLRTLNLAHNAIADLPSEIEDLLQLQMLDLSSTLMSGQQAVIQRLQSKGVEVRVDTKNEMGV